MGSLNKHRVEIPEASFEDWRIEKIGENTALSKSGCIWMIDSDDEVEWMLPAVKAAKGDVLVGGLGLGMYVSAIIDKSEVTHITIIEKEYAVILFSGELYDHPKVTIIIDDILDYENQPDKTYDVAFIDIWNKVTTQGYAEIRSIQKRLGKHCEKMYFWREKDFEAASSCQ